ncbi:unnamed protein product [Linum tenue]|uniref:Uncharacterized protein n=1 Tax=Linum tenue TaxID=586396 RepID=A0AAV0RZI6_9ROSI|nr:unnamed protein product [Linum tenue]
MENHDIFALARSNSLGGGAPNVEDQDELPMIFPGAIGELSFPPSATSFPHQDAPHLAPAGALGGNSSSNDAPLSVEDLVRIAASKFVRSRSNNTTSFDVQLSEDESESVALAQLLLEAAEEVGERRFDPSRTLLDQCDRRSSPTGNPVQRLVFYYSQALRDRIDRETGRSTSPSETVTERSSDLYKVVMIPSIRSIEFQSKIPFSHAAQFAGIQAIVEHLDGTRKIHILDFAVRNGQQWIILMQALASRPKRRRVRRLKITAVATLGQEQIERTGSRLVSYAESVGLPCKFDVVMVSDLAELRRDHIQVEPDEAVAVLAEYVLHTMTEPMDRLDSLVRVIRSFNPCVMVVGEVEGNMNSPVFIDRFVESLFFTSAFFDCMEECMGRDEVVRKYGEETLFGAASKIVVAIEGRERIIRNMKVDVWRTYFQRFGMWEVELSRSSLYQAELVTKRLPSWGPCTVGMDGKSLIVGWKGTPIKSVTVWKF